MLSEELRRAGGLESLKKYRDPKTGWKISDKGFHGNTDQDSFQEFLEEAGLDSSVTEVTVNRIWDKVNSHFRAKAYLPFISA